MPELREIASMHGINDQYALVVWDTNEDTPEPCKGSVKRWLATHSGAVNVWFSPLVKDLPDLPSQPKIHQAAAPTTEELTPIRIIAYQMHQPGRWKDIRRDPVKHFLSILPPDFHLRTYGWREVLTDGQAAVMGYAKTPQSKRDVILALAGKGGWFLEPLRCNVAEKKPVAWLTKQPDETPAVYFCRALALSTQKKLPLACHHGGGSNLGIRGGDVDANAVSKWVAAGIPSDWQPTTLTKWITAQK